MKQKETKWKQKQKQKTKQANKQTSNRLLITYCHT